MEPTDRDFVAERSALVLVEVQKNYTDAGLFHRLVRRGLRAGGVVQNLQRLTTRFREVGALVVHAPLIIDRNAPDYRRTPLFPRMFGQLTAGTWRAELTDGVHAPGDRVVRGRAGFDATEGTDLVAILQESDVESVFLGGFTTDHCVSCTMRSLVERGFDCAFVSDGTATHSARLQRATESRLACLSTAELLQRIRS